MVVTKCDKFVSPKHIEDMSMLWHLHDGSMFDGVITGEAQFWHMFL
jgi:hypothetical protein